MTTGKVPHPKTVDEYISRSPRDVRRILEAVRLTIRRAAPEAKEAIRYGIPTFILKGHLLSFAAFKNHIGLYPAPAGSPSFNRRLSAYRAAKSTVRLPLDEPMPLHLIGQMVRLRVKDNLKRARARAKPDQE